MPKKTKAPPLTAEARRMNSIARLFKKLSLAGMGWTVGRVTADYERAVKDAKDWAGTYR